MHQKSKVPQMMCALGYFVDAVLDIEEIKFQLNVDQHLTGRLNSLNLEKDAI